MVTNNITNISGAGIVKYNGAGTFSAITVTQHDVLLGAASNGITSLAPSATVGIALVSQGAAADPAFGSVVVAGGGTGATTFTPYAVLTGGTTSTGAIQNVSGVGTAGQVLTSNGAGTLPSWQAASIPGTLSTLTGNSGGAVSPTTGNITTAGSGSITIVGNPGTSTLTTSLTGITNHNVLVGSGTDTITNVAPSATVGTPLISQGVSGDPIFGVASVPGGGTGSGSFTAYSIIAAGTTSTGAFQNVSGLGTSGQILTSNGAGSLPTWQANPGSSVVVASQIFTASGTYTPTASMKYCLIQCLGGGGAGGGAASTNSNNFSAGAGGSGGEYAQGIFSAATIGASRVVTIGAGGIGVSGGTGGNGGTTSVGVLITANGGHGSPGTGSTFNPLEVFAGTGGTGGSGGDFRVPGQIGGYAIANAVASATAGLGANSQYGAGGNASINTAGNPGLGYGSGGGGAANGNNGSNRAGGNGAPGIVIITEYI